MTKSTPFLIPLILFIGIETSSQQLRATVVVNSDQVAQPSERVFRELQSRVNHFLNNQVFGPQKVLIQEKVHCNFIFVIEQYFDNQFIGTLQIQSFRPIYGSNYVSPVLNYLDKDIAFEFRENTSMNYNDNFYTTELMAILGFYVHLILTYDSDSFSPLGGQPHLRKARLIQRNARSYSKQGWSPQANTRNRYELIRELDSSIGPLFRNSALYDYHRSSMDQFVHNTSDATEKLFDVINEFDSIHVSHPRSMLVQLFFDAKAQELFDILFRSPTKTPQSVINSLKQIAPRYSHMWSQL